MGPTGTEYSVNEWAQHGPNESLRMGPRPISSFVMLFGNLSKKELNFAGAMRPLYWLKKTSSSEIETIKPSRFGIGDENYTNQKQYFKDHFIAFKEGDRCYLFTDGFLDQFGGDDDKKFLGKRFKELLYSLKNVPITDHEAQLYNSFVDWKGIKGEQTDDILVIGLEF